MDNKDMVEVEFTHLPHDKQEIFGPFEYVQITYGEVRAYVSGDDNEITLAVYGRNLWVAQKGVYTDVIIRPATSALCVGCSQRLDTSELVDGECSLCIEAREAQND